MVNALSIDVEDYFHPSEVQPYVQASEWTSLPSRVADNTSRTLDLLDRHGVKATFFVLGWVAEHHPELVRRIAAAGHEVGCHSYAHRLVYDLTPDEFRADTEAAGRVIREACGVTPRAYRAPSYSITSRSLWALDILASLGFTHDSSIYPVAHDRYGIPGFHRHAHVLPTKAGPITEVPVAAVALSRRHTAPVGGGAWLRLFPYRYTAAGIRAFNAEGQPACIYFHPWEIDAGQPRLNIGFVSRLRTYTGLAGMRNKLDRLLREFPFAPLASVYPEGSCRVANSPP